MALRIAFNATPLLSPLTGIGNYILHLGAALAATGDVDAWSFYGYHWRHEAPAARPGGTERSFTTHRIAAAIKPWVPFKRPLRHAVQARLFARGVARNGIDLYHEPNYVPLGYDVPVVVTVHDLSWLHFPETHPADRVRWLERGLPRAIAHAAAILCDSEFVRQEVIAQFGVPAARVHTAHLGVAADFMPRAAAATAATLRPRGLAHGEYILTVGTIEPRKNLRHVLAAYARLPARMRERFPLVVAGARGWRAGDLEADLAQLAERGRIRFLGHVEQAALPDLYAGAALFVFPSTYEGFGLPPLEAMASGVPVLASNRASIPEVVGDAVVLIDPDRPEDTAARMEAALDDPALRAALAQRGTERAATFTWARCAAATLRAYRAAGGAIAAPAGGGTPA